MKLIEKGFFKRNKKFLLSALIIFLVPFFVGIIHGYLLVGDDYGYISNAIYTGLQSGQHPMSFPEFSSIDLFIHNFFADLLVIFGGFLFSIISVIFVVYNGYAIGVPFGTDFIFAATSIIPHSIIEYPAAIFALAAAFNITWLEIKMIKNRSFKSVLEENKIVLNDILTMFVIMVVLLFIAALIEGNLTIPFIYWFYGM